MSRHCLYCSKPLAEIGPVSARCPACGKAQTRRELAEFRTLAPDAVRRQRLASAGVLGALALGGLAFFLQTDPPPGAVRHFGLGALALVIVAAIALDTVSLITRRRARLDPVVVWPVMLGGCTVALLALVV